MKTWKLNISMFWKRIRNLNKVFVDFDQSYKLGENITFGGFTAGSN